MAGLTIDDCKLIEWRTLAPTSDSRVMTSDIFFYHNLQCRLQLSAKNDTFNSGSTLLLHLLSESQIPVSFTTIVLLSRAYGVVGCASFDWICSNSNNTTKRLIMTLTKAAEYEYLFFKLILDNIMNETGKLLDNLLLSFLIIPNITNLIQGILVFGSHYSTSNSLTNNNSYMALIILLKY